MDKLIAMKIKYDDGTYSDEIPICAFVENVNWDESHTLVDVLGNVNLNSSIQDQITYLFNNKMDATALENYVASELEADVTAWLNAHVTPAGSAVVVDDSLSISGAAADAKAVGDEIANLAQIEPGLSAEAKTALLNCFEHVALFDDGNGIKYIEALRNALYEEKYPYLYVVFNPGTTVIYDDYSLDDLRPYFTVRYYTAKEEYTTVTEYILSGNLNTAESVIIVSYMGLNRAVYVNVIVGRALTINDIDSSIGYVNLTVENGNIDYENSQSFSVLALNESIKHIRFTAQNINPSQSGAANELRLALWRVFGKNGTTYYCSDASGSLFEFSLNDDKYKATKNMELATVDPNPGDISGLDSISINSLRQDVIVKNGIQTTVIDGIVRTSITNSTMIGFWASVAVSSKMKMQNVRVYDE